MITYMGGCRAIVVNDAIFVIAFLADSHEQPFARYALMNALEEARESRR